MTGRRDLESALRDRYDVVVVGGGALGCAMSWEAASRGLRVALLEREDFGSGTSANSLRIVHGGLRYLQKMDFLRARRSAGERSSFLRIAPHLVAPLRCAIPTMASWTRGRLALAAGLAFNALLTFDRNRDIDPVRRLPAGGLIDLQTMGSLAPGIPASDWTGGACWYDALMLDSERLCLAFAKSAQQHGACVLNHVEAINIERTGPGENTIAVSDRLSGANAELRSRVVIDCRGLAMPGSMKDTRGYRLDVVPNGCVKAVNLVLDATPTGCAVGFPARDSGRRPIPGRLFFALPYHDAVAVGTWYFHYDGVPDRPSLDANELNRILDDLRSSTDWDIAPSAIRALHVGLLPAAAGTSGAPAAPADRPSITREKDCDSHFALWQVCTEKWTTVRDLAQTAIDRIVEHESLSAGASISSSAPLYGADFESIEGLHAEAQSLQPPGVEKQLVNRLTERYGQNAIQILHQIGANPELAERMPEHPDVTRAEVAYSVTEEMAYTLPDLVLRRLGLGATGCPSVESLEFAADVLGSQIGWSDEDRRINIEAVQGHRSFHVV